VIIATPELVAALKTAKAQCLIRVTQLANCRVCGDDHQRFEATVQQLTQLIDQLEAQRVQTFPTQP